MTFAIVLVVLSPGPYIISKTFDFNDSSNKTACSAPYLAVRVSPIGFPAVLSMYPSALALFLILSAVLVGRSGNVILSFSACALALAKRLLTVAGAISSPCPTAAKLSVSPRSHAACCVDFAEPWPKTVALQEKLTPMATKRANSRMDCFLMVGSPVNKNRFISKETRQILRQAVPGESIRFWCSSEIRDFLW